MHIYFHLFSRTIPAYGLFMALGLCLAAIFALIRCKNSGIHPNDVLIILCICFLGALVGGKLLYLLATYGAGQIRRDIAEGDFSFLFSGGLVFYGGLVGGLLLLPLGLRVSGEHRLNLLANAVVPCIPLGHAIGRVGCLFAGCCYGLPYSGFGAVNLSEAGILYPVFPIQLVEAGINLLLSAGLLLLGRRKLQGFRLLYVYLMVYALERFTLEFFRGDILRGMTAGLSTSQWISIFLFILSATLALLRFPGKAYAR